jgi:alkyl hydroperoxide reductase subunit AhpC
LASAVSNFGFSLLLIGDIAPDFEADTTHGRIRFHDWIGDSWCMLFSHPKNFTPVCTTELGYLARLKPEFDRRNCRIIGLSVDPVEDHMEWGRDIADVMGHEPDFPIIGDPHLKIARIFGMLPATGEDAADKRTAANNATVRTVHILAPDKSIKAMLTYPMSSGRNFYEMLRLLDAIQISEPHPIVTPVQWERGQDVMISPKLSNEEAREKFPDGWIEAKPYLRYVPPPADS